MKFPTINFSKQVKQIERLITDNSPMILTAFGVVGTVGTAVLAAKAHGQATQIETLSQLIDDNQTTAPTEVLTPITPPALKAIVKHNWKLYIPPVITGTLTVASIIGAQKINARRAAAIAGVLAMTQDNFKEYRDKVAEKMTGPQHKKLKDELATDKAKRVFDKETPYIVPDGEAIFVEAYTMRQFPCTKHKILQAETNFNREMMRSGELGKSLSEFYDSLGLEHTAVSDNVGWNIKNPLEIEFTVTETPEGKPAFVINYMEEPIFRPWNAGGY